MASACFSHLERREHCGPFLSRLDLERHRSREAQQRIWRRPTVLHHLWGAPIPPSRFLEFWARFNECCTCWSWEREGIQTPGPLCNGASKYGQACQMNGPAECHGPPPHFTRRISSLFFPPQLQPMLQKSFLLLFWKTEEISCYSKNTPVLDGWLLREFRLKPHQNVTAKFESPDLYPYPQS